MKKSEMPDLIIDGEDAFPHFEDPEWVKMMLAKAEKQAVQRFKPKRRQQQGESAPASSSSSQHH